MRYTPEEIAELLKERPNQPHYIAGLVRQAVKEEREACAKIAEMPKYLNETGILTVNPAKSAAAHFIAIAIRARGSK